MRFNVMYDNGEKILTGIHPSEGNYCPNNLHLPEGITQIGEGAFANRPEIQYVSIPNSVKNINYAAFHDCTGLLGVTIPDSVEGIDEEAFWGCARLEKINWGKNLKFIGRHAFAKCKNLKGPMIMPQNLVTIGARVFAGTGVTAITLGTKAKDISPVAFRGRGESKIKKIIISPKNPNYYVNNNWIITKKTKILIGAAGDKANKIPTDIKGIGIDACAGLPIKKVEFNKVKIIGGGAFENCDQLTTIRISKNVEEIRGEAFAGCKNLEAIEIEEKSKLKEIGMNAFNGCRKLIPPKFDEKKVKISPYAFAFCGEEKPRDIFLSEIITRLMALTDEEKASIILERFK